MTSGIGLEDGLCGFPWMIGIVIGGVMTTRLSGVELKGSFSDMVKVSFAISIIVLGLCYTGWLIFFTPAWFNNPQRGWGGHSVAFGWQELVMLWLAVLLIAESWFVPVKGESSSAP